MWARQPSGRRAGLVEAMLAAAAVAAAGLAPRAAAAAAAGGEDHAGDTGDRTADPSSAPAPAPLSTPAATAPPRGYPSPAVATVLAVSLTVGGLGLTSILVPPVSRTDLNLAWVGLSAATLLLAPSAGHLYAGIPGPALAHAGIRVGTLALTAVTWFLLVGSAYAEDATSAYVLLGGLIFISASTVGDAVWELATTWRDVARARLRRHARRAPAVSLVPVVSGTDGRPLAGATVAVLGW